MANHIFILATVMLLAGIFGRGGGLFFSSCYSRHG